MNKSRKKESTEAALIALIEKKSREKSVVVAIDGRCAAGKTTLAKTLSEHFGCEVIHMDDFFLPKDLRTNERLSEPGGNIHYERFSDEVVNGVKSGKPFEYGVFNCASMSFKEARTHIPSRVTVIEGAYSLHPLFADLYDIKIFCDISPEEQKRRIIERNGAEAYKAFKDKWIPMEERYLSHYNIKELCEDEGRLQNA